tara:strand:+ start:494 stop:1183 length:690 start_codon:yes stop_codon:yes gene_type:complete
MIKKAMILAAGFGKRIQPLTFECPKPLLKIGSETLLFTTLKFLQELGIKQVVINVHHLSEQIIDYISENKFNLNIVVVDEKEKILNTGGGILNAVRHFDGNFLCINPDTIWNLNYIKEIKDMENKFLSSKTKISMLVVKKEKSFDKNLKGDFNLENNLINKKNQENLKYIYTGLQIIKPEVFQNIKERVFSINKIWDKLIESDELSGFESNIEFKHVSTLDIYKKLNIN